MDRRAALADLLAKHLPVDVREQRHLTRMRALLELPGDPFARNHFEPGHFTASAFVLSPDSECVLLVLHAKLGRWLQPGGHVEPADPSLLDTALRELGEETGVSDVDLLAPGPLDVDVHLIPPAASAPAHEHFDVRFIMRAHSELCRAGTDARSTRWFPLASVSATASDASVLRAIEKIRSDGRNRPGELEVKPSSPS